MGIATVAEYVETDEIRTRVAALGVDFGQGFAIARPEPLEGLLEELPVLAAASPVANVDARNYLETSPLIAKTAVSH
jgi:EAL domain-containing protein (putative c-di-GMP-specific phosphodiesterase class I)